MCECSTEGYTLSSNQRNCIGTCTKVAPIILNDFSRLLQTSMNVWKVRWMESQDVREERCALIMTEAMIVIVRWVLWEIALAFVKVLAKSSYATASLYVVTIYHLLHSGWDHSASSSDDTDSSSDYRTRWDRTQEQCQCNPESEQRGGM